METVHSMKFKESWALNNKSTWGASQSGDRDHIGQFNVLSIIKILKSYSNRFSNQLFFLVIC